MRVLLATDVLPHPPRGGLDRHVAELAHLLVESGVDARVVGLSGRSVESVLKTWPADIVHIHSLQSLPEDLPQRARRRGTRVLWTLHDFYAICPRTHLHRADSGSCEGPEQGQACRPCVGGWRGLLGGVGLERRWRRMRAALEACDRLIAPSAFVLDQLVEDGHPVDQIVQISPAGPAPERRAEPPISGAPPRLVYAGDLREAKGVDVLLAALPMLRGPISVDILGGPGTPPAPAEPAFKRRISELAKGQAVRFLGRYARQGMVDHLDRADAVVLPSRVRESFGRVANEALQCGVPVVVPAGGGMAEQVRPGWNGLLFERGDVADLARALQRLVEDETALRPRESWSPASSAESELGKLHELYRSLM